MENKVQSFRVDIPQTEVDNLRQRLKDTRWPNAAEGAGWDYGADLFYIKTLVEYWGNEYDWRKREKQLNSLPHFTASVNGQTIHFIHHKSSSPGAIPLVLLHGWPSSFLQMLQIAPLLLKGDAPSFDLIIPSLPGYGFSSKPVQKGMTVYEMGLLLHSVITEQLGYEKYVIRASDIGAGVAKEIALAYPEAILGLHLSGSNPYVYQMPKDLSEAEKKFLADGKEFLQKEGAYAMLQSSKPQTPAFALNDSPAGLAAWIVEKFRNWSDSNGNVESRFSKDELLDNISLYWFTQTIATSIRVYYESAHNFSPNANKQVSVPTGFAMHAKDIAVGPREWEERTYNVVYWKEYPKGGHFAEWEEPKFLADDIRSFVKKLKLT